MKIRVREIAEAKGVRNANDLAARTGIFLRSAYRLWSGEAKMISTDTLDRLHKTFNVPPGLWFEIVPDEPKNK